MAVKAKQVWVGALTMLGACADSIDAKDSDQDAGPEIHDDAGDAEPQQFGEVGAPRNAAVYGLGEVTDSEFFRQMKGNYSVHCVAAGGLAKPGAAFLQLAGNGSMRMASAEGTPWIESIVKDAGDKRQGGNAGGASPRDWIFERKHGEVRMSVRFSPEGEIEVTGSNDDAELRCLWRDNLADNARIDGLPEPLKALAGQTISLRNPAYSVSFTDDGKMTILKDGEEVLSRAWLGGNLPRPFDEQAGDLYLTGNGNLPIDVQMNYPDVQLHFDRFMRLTMINAPVEIGAFWVEVPHECTPPVGSQVVMPWTYVGTANDNAPAPDSISSDGEALLVHVADRILRTRLVTGETELAFTYTNAGVLAGSWPTSAGMIVRDGENAARIGFSGQAVGAAISVPTGGVVFGWNPSNESLLAFAYEESGATLSRVVLNGTAEHIATAVPNDYRHDWRVTASGSVFTSPKPGSDVGTILRIDPSGEMTELHMTSMPDGSFGTSLAGAELLGVTNDSLFYQVGDDAITQRFDRKDAGVFRTSHAGGDTQRLLDQPLKQATVFQAEHALYVREASALWRFDDAGEKTRLAADIACDDFPSPIFVTGGYVYSATFVADRSELQVWRLKE